MTRLIDLTGKRFGKLTVIERAGTYRSENSPYSSTPTWRCVCDCGKETIVIGRNLVSGATKSCGCMRHGPRAKRGPMQYVPGNKIETIPQLAAQKRVFWNNELISRSKFSAWAMSFAKTELEKGNILEAR